jgi:hypothetical protein
VAIRADPVKQFALEYSLHAFLFANKASFIKTSFVQEQYLITFCRAVALYGACALSHASAAAQGNVVRAMSATYRKSLYSTRRTNQTP